MARIAVVGAGVVGIAFAKITLAVTQHDVLLIDVHEVRLGAAVEQIIITMSDLIAQRLDVTVCQDLGTLKTALSSCDLVACCTPFDHVAAIATLAAELQLSYLDFTEDVSVTALIGQLKTAGCTFVPQTGVAPGLINYMGLDLIQGLKVEKLSLRVGALAQNPPQLSRYAITWSPEGLINEYLKPVLRKEGGTVVCVEPLQELEILQVEGAEYEAFTTSGGVGDLSAYEHVPNVEYKTMRHPGHLAFLTALLKSVNYCQQAAVDLAVSIFERTREDVVAMACEAVDHNGKVYKTAMHFWPNHDLELTAIELTTAGTGVAVAELILAKSLPFGTLRPHQISLHSVLNTGAGRLLRREFDNK